MKIGNFIKTCVGLSMCLGLSSHANWGGSSSMMPFSMQNGAQPRMQSNSWARQQNHQTNYRRVTPSNVQPWTMSSMPTRQVTQPQAQPFGMGMMPFNTTTSNSQAQPFGGMDMMPFGSKTPSTQTQPFGGMSMMPFNPGIQPQQQFTQPSSSSFMMPGMDQGIRSMMEPGKIMAEEATPGVYMTPTWR